MPNDEIINKIEELKKICDPKETEATLVYDLRQINEKIANIQRELSELKNIPDPFYYDEIQESRDITRKAELQKQIRELEKESSLLNIELKELKNKEAEIFENLKVLQQIKTQNANTASTVKSYEETLTTKEAKDNISMILTEVEKKVEEDTKAFQDLATQYKSVQDEIVKKSSLINSVKENISNLQNQMDQLSNDLKEENKYINQEKKNADLTKVKKLEDELKSLTEKQTAIVSNPIMSLSLASKSAIDSDMVATLNKIQSVKETLLQEPYMDIPKESIDEVLAKAIEDRETFYNQINGKNYESNGLKAADDRIDDNNASLAKWTEEINSLKDRKEEIDNGTKYGSASKIKEITEEIIKISKEIEEFEDKGDMTSDEEVAVEKRKTEVETLKQLLNMYFADQNVNIKEAECIEANIKILDERTAAIKAETKTLKKMSKSFAGTDTMAQKRDRDELKKYVDAVMDIKKLPQYHRALTIIDEILDTLGKDIVVPTIEEKEEALVTGNVETAEQVMDTPVVEEQKEEVKEEPISEIHPIEDVKADEITPPLEEEKEEIAVGKEQDPSTLVEESKTSGVVFEQAFKDEPVKESITAISDDEITAEINKSLSENASKVVDKEEINHQMNEINPFANISDLQTVEAEPQKESTIPTEDTRAVSDILSSSALKVENQEDNVVLFPTNESIQTASVETPIEEIKEDISMKQEVPSSNSIDDFFAAQWEQVTNDDVQSLGKVA